MPKKNCPHCQAKIPVACKTCKLCGTVIHESRRKPPPPVEVKFGRVPVNAETLSAHHYLGVQLRLTKEQKAEIDPRLKAGESRTKIAKEMGLPTKSIQIRIYHLRAQRQIEMPQSRPNPKYERAHEMWREGYKIREIAEAYNSPLRRMAGVIEHYRKVFGWFSRRTKSHK